MNPIKAKLKEYLEHKIEWNINIYRMGTTMYQTIPHEFGARMILAPKEFLDGIIFTAKDLLRHHFKKPIKEFIEFVHLMIENYKEKMLNWKARDAWWYLGRSDLCYNTYKYYMKDLKK